MLILHKLFSPGRTRQSLAALALLTLSLSSVGAQSTAEPRREQLLNGLKILLVERTGEAQATLRLRVHSGAAFDLAGKEGTLALLGDALFSDPSTREYVTGDLQGRLEVSTGFDSIDVLLTGRAEEFERLVELLRNAVISTQLSPDVLTRLREARLKTVRELGVSPETMADRAILSRLFGSYPYGRPAAGSAESLAHITHSDLMLARERFLSPDNATLVVIGGVEQRRALRAIRQFLGAWRKSDRAVPATFRQPDAVDPRTLVVDLPGVPDAQLRIAARGVARSDRDAAAALVLAEVVRERWLTAAPELKGKAVSVVHSAHAFGGMFQMGASLPASSVARSLESARKVLETLVKSPPAPEELTNAKSAALAILNKQAERPERAADVWLDEQTYRSASATIPALATAVNSLTPADVQRVAVRLFGANVATVAVGDAASLRDELARVGGVELFGAPKEAPKPQGPTPLKPPTTRRP